MASKKGSNSVVKTFNTSVDLPQATLGKSIDMLNKSLADTLDLFSQLKQAHWNVKGMEFYQLHLLFDEFAEHAEGWVDEIAERATALGGYATGTVRMAAGSSRLPEYPTSAVDGVAHTRAVVEHLGLYAKPSAPRSMLPIKQATPARRISSRRSADVSTRISGSPKPICKANALPTHR